MPEIEVVETPLTPAEQFAKFKADKAAAATPEGIAKAAADKAAAAAAPVVPPAEKRASGDERKFNRKLRLRDEQIGALRAELDALKPKPAATTSATTDAVPKREDFATDDEFTDAKIAHATAKALAKANTEAAQAQEIRDTLAGYNERMAKAPEKYPDWDEVLKAGSGAALSVDLGRECPALFWAIARSPNNDDVFYEWLKDSSKLQSLIDLYKSGPKGEVEALTAFHRFEGKVAREAKAKEPEKKADDAVKVPKPKPSAEAVVRGGAAAPDGKPEVYLPGTHTLNPAYKAWMHQRGAR